MESRIGVTVVDPVMSDDGWHIPEGEGPVSGARLMRDIYRLGMPGHGGRATVPVLWDNHHGRIVSHESSDIMEAIASWYEAETGFANPLFPSAQLKDIEYWNARLQWSVNSAVYRAGFASNLAEHEREKKSLFDALSRIDVTLHERPFLLGHRPLAPDWRMFCTLVRLDEAYAPYLGCDLKRLDDFPALARLTRTLAQMPVIASTINMDHIKRSFAARARQLGLNWAGNVGRSAGIATPA
jgi:glutathionyl-hydroquinone reductase